MFVNFEFYESLENKIAVKEAFVPLILCDSHYRNCIFKL